jgi:hypothetical protein
VLLQIAIMCLILQPDSARFGPLVRKFAAVCDADGDLVVRLVQNPPRRDMTPPEAEPIETPRAPDPAPFAPLLEPFELAPEPSAQTPPQLSPEEQIIAIAGPDSAHWFDGDELTKWKAARLCVAHFTARLDPNSFSIVPA